MDSLFKRTIIAMAIGLSAFAAAQQAIATQGFAVRTQTLAANTAHGELTRVEMTDHLLFLKTSAADRQFQYDDRTRVIGAERGTEALPRIIGSQVTIEYRTEGQIDLAITVRVDTPRPPPTGPATE